MEWQPIETAPLDDTDIIVATKSGLVGEAYFCQAFRALCWAGTDIDEQGGIYDATHWMHLPPHPGS